MATEIKQTADARLPSDLGLMPHERRLTSQGRAHEPAVTGTSAAADRPAMEA